MRTRQAYDVDSQFDQTSGPRFSKGPYFTQHFRGPAPKLFDLESTFVLREYQYTPEEIALLNERAKVLGWSPDVVVHLEPSRLERA